MTLKFISKASVPDGYFGDRLNTALYFNTESGYTIALGDGHKYKTEIPRALDVEEVIWLIENNPALKGRILLQR